MDDTAPNIRYLRHKMIAIVLSTCAIGLWLATSTQPIDPPVSGGKTAPVPKPAP